MEIIKSNPFKKDSQAWIFCDICNLDFKNGHSEMVYLKKLTEHGLQLGNGGSWCRDDGPLGRRFNVFREKEKGKIIGVQLVGYKKNKFTNIIKKEILDFYRKLPCKILNIRGGYIEIDHKDGRKDDFGLNKNQKKRDFQPLHKSANDAKRQHCKECKKTGKRFDAKRLGYIVSQWIGTKEYNGSCIGCFWFDPAEFNSQISFNFKKDR